MRGERAREYPVIVFFVFFVFFVVFVLVFVLSLLFVFFVVVSLSCRHLRRVLFL